MSDFITAGIRTIVPWAVATVVSWLTTLGLAVSTDLQTHLTLLFTFILGSAYYLIVKALEKKWPKVGVLLGVPKAPTYGDKPAPDINPDELTD